MLLQEGGPLPEPESGLLSNTWKWIVQGGTYADKARYFIGNGHLGREQEGEGTQEDVSAMWLAVRFCVDEISFWPIILKKESFLVAYPLLRQDRMSARRILGGGRTGGVSFWPFLSSSIWWWLNSSTFLTETSCGKILMQIVIIVPGLGGWF